MARAGVDNFDFLLSRNIRGYNSDTDPSTIEGDWLVRGSQNVYKDSAGNIVNRCGRKLFTGDPTDTTIAGTKAAYVWNTSLGATRRVRIADSKLQVASDIVTTGTFVWYNLESSLTKTRGVFEPWWNNTLKKDQLIIVIGDNSLRMWSGGIGKISSTTGTTIVLTASVASQGFNTSSGNVIINGTTYAYTGSSSATLTGVTPDPTGEANGSAVVQALVTTTNTPVSDSTTFTNDFIKVVNNRLHVGSYISRLCYISSNSDYTNFTVPATRTAGTPELLTLDGALNGIGVRQGKAHISAGQSDWYVVSYEQITVSTTLQEVTTVEKQDSANQAAAYAHEFIDTVNDTIVYLSKDQQLRAFGTFKNLNTPSYPILSLEVADELAAADFTLGQLRAIAQEGEGILIYITAPNSGVSYIHQTRIGLDQVGNVTSERRWFSPFVWGLSRIDVAGGDVIGFSNSNPQVYTLWATGQFIDDNPDGNTAYVSVAVFPYKSYGRRQGKLRASKLYTEGYMSQNTVLNANVYFDYQGSSGLQSLAIHDPTSSPANNQSFFSGSAPPSLGDSSLGDNPLGSPSALIGVGNTELLDHDLLPKFRIINGISLTDFYEVAVALYSSSDGARWELIAIGLSVEESLSQAVELVKVNN